MSTIAVIGATGYAGTRIVNEARARGHAVIAVSRHQPDEVTESVEWRAGDIANATLVSELASAADVVLIAVRGSDEGRHVLAPLVPSILASVSQGGARLGVVGGAASLRVAPGGPRLLDSPDFPDAYRAEAESHVAVLDALRSSPSDADWFYVSPSAEFGAHSPGTRTGAYRVSDEVLLADESGRSYISGEDMAVAIIDEIERPAHHRQRFTVGY